MESGSKIIGCTCGKVELEVTGSPIMCGVCHCADCHEGSFQIQSLPHASSILDSYGGTTYVIYRKDRIKYKKGTEHLKNLKVGEDSSNRTFASCCNAFMLLDLPRPMHWAPINRNLFQGEVPPIEMRINAKFKSGVTEVPHDVPVYSSFPLKFIAKLLGARLAMLFGR